ncbi:RNI-like protein [Obba rivulosa]|uniref:RNI-like protein n=1 Tax=Obba rivulosa TaxID=1052685 RepID=A0A8E2ARN3_9APHY|nr:RNI-like protein [Obba rivulosa]
MNPLAFSLSTINQPTMTKRAPAIRQYSLSMRAQIEQLDAGLTAVAGARAVISEITSRRRVTKLILGHNSLGDEGCEVLFRFLCSEEGRRYKISEISLNTNGIGDRGLLAISRYLRFNTSLKELFLQNNALAGSPPVIKDFTDALNTSNLELLSLASNIDLSDTFVTHFFPNLDSPHLQEVHLNMLGITQSSVPTIIEYISSPRCLMHTLKINGNRLGLRGVSSIIRAVHRRNFTLLKLEMYANSLSDNAIQQDSERELKKVLMRNEHLKKATEREALALLRYSRAVLLRPRSWTLTPSSAVVPCSDLCACARAHNDPLSPTSSLFSSIGTTHRLLDSQPSKPPFPFMRLPTELQLHILSFLAPILSSAQRIRIYTYASTPTTLPSLLPCLTSRSCIPDPTSPQFGEFNLGGGMTMRKRSGCGSSASSGCADGKCMGAGNSVKCRREEERAKWLAAVRCNAFELDEDGTWSGEHEGGDAPKSAD